MSGRKHHYLPQLIQRSFAYRQRGKEFYVHAHHRTHGRFTPNTSGLGKEMDFYGGPDDTSLDDAITQGEDALAATVQAINQGIDVAPIDMATLISALAFRTKSMREAMVGMFPAVVAALRLRFLNITRLRQDLMESLTDPKERKRLIYEQIDKNMQHLTREQRVKAYYALLPMWKSHVVNQEEQLVAEAWRFTSFFLAKLRDEADTIAEGAYRKALAKDPAMPIRAKIFAADLTFEVLSSPPGEFFILGDCGPVAMFTDGKPRLVLGALSNDAEIETLLLPTSPTRCIVGRLPSATSRLSVTDINRISAALSLEFFISDRDMGEELEELRASIGSLVPVDTEDDIIRGMLNEQA